MTVDSRWVLLVGGLLAGALMALWFRRKLRTERTDDQHSAISSASVQLFARDVPLARLPLSLSIEVSGGNSIPFVECGTRLPIAQREVFSTSAENQDTVTVHVLVGEHRNAADNVTVGKFSFTTIAPAPRGITRLEATFEVDKQGRFRFTARDAVTGQRQPIAVKETLATPLSLAKVAALLDAAEQRS